MNLGLIGAQALRQSAIIDVAMPATVPRPLVRNSNSNSNIAGNEITVSAELKSTGGEAALFARARTSCSSESSGSSSPPLAIETESGQAQRSPSAESAYKAQCSPPIQGVQPITNTRTLTVCTDFSSSPSKGPVKASSPISSPSASGSDASPANPSAHPTIFRHILDTQSPLSDQPTVNLSNGTVQHSGSEHGEEEDEDGEEEEGDGEEAETMTVVRMCKWEGCTQHFSDLPSLVTHLEREHTMTMVKYTCQWEGCCRSMKPFDARYKLVTHLRCHTGEKPYRCNIPTCNRSFSRLENLKLHIRTHTGEKPYMCHYESCCKKFNNTSDRAKHMKTHITRKPYACKHPGCGRSYTDPSSMRKHIKFAHKLKEEGLLNGHTPDVDGPAMRKHSRHSSLSSLPSPGSAPSPKRPNNSTDPSLSPLLPSSALRSPSSPAFTNTSAMLSPSQAALFSVPLFQLPGQGPSTHTQGAGLHQHSDGVLIPNSAPQSHPMVLFLGGGGGGAGITHDQFMYATHPQYYHHHQTDNGKNRQPCSELTSQAKQKSSGTSPSTSSPRDDCVKEHLTTPTTTAGQFSQFISVMQPSMSVSQAQPLGSGPQSTLMAGLVPTYMRLAPVLPSPLHLANFTQGHSKPMALLGSQHHLSLGTGAPITQYMIPQFMVSGMAQSQPLMVSGMAQNQPLILSMVPIMSHPNPAHTETLREPQ